MKISKVTRPQQRASKAVRSQSGVAHTLVSPAGMGGIIGGDGYAFQMRYIVCQIPRWLANPRFTDLAHEMTGDVDVRYDHTHSASRDHIQVKNHEVSNAELKRVVEDFAKWGAGMPGTYSRFTLACVQVGKSLRPLEAGLRRLRGASRFYSDKQSALTTTTQDVTRTIGRIGLGAYERLVLDKLYIETGLSDFHTDDRAVGIFTSEMQKLRRYEHCTAKDLRPAYDTLFNLVSSSRGQSLNRLQLEQVTEASIRQAGGKESSRVYLDVHNWTREVYKPKADYELDWSSQFDRATRSIPAEIVWNNDLLPALYQLAKTISGNTPTRVVQFRGRCCLSAALAVGAAFPENGGWVFEVSQPQMPTTWRSDAATLPAFSIKCTETKISRTGDSVVLMINVTGKATAEVKDFIVKSKLPAKTLICIEPSGPTGSRSITSDSEAVSLAVRVRDYLKQALVRRQVQITHLFYYGPQGLAIFLGQKLTSLGRIQVYEYQNPGYAPTCLLRT